jgi:hypothetical protein
MKLTYRQATEMSGYLGMHARGQIYNKILLGFYAQPHIKTGIVKALMLGIIYGLTVAVLALALPLGQAELLFSLFGFGGAASLAMFAAPLKGLFVFVSENVDKEYDV